MVTRFVFTLAFILLLPASIVAQTSLPGCQDGNCANGVGKFVFENGDIYMGQWEKELPQGAGTFYNDTDESIYYGEFMNGLPDKIGYRKKKDGTVAYEFWMDGILRRAAELTTEQIPLAIRNSKDGIKIITHPFYP